MSQETEEGKYFTLDIPQREGKEGYIGTFLSSHLNLEAVLKSPEFTREPIRVYYLMEARISLIPDEEERQKIYNKLDEKLKDLKANYKKDNGIETLSPEQDSHLLIIASLRTLGQVTDFVDKHIALSVKNKVGFERRQPKKLKPKEEGSHETG